MTYKMLMKFYGSQAAIAKAGEVKVTAVKQWNARGHVPIKKQLLFQRKSRGKLKAS